MSKSFAVSAPRIFDGKIWHSDAALVVQDASCVVTSLDALPADIDHERLETGLLAPGFVDIQVNGGGGVLLNNSPTVDGIRTICLAHAKLGTTSVLPTLITDTPEIENTALQAGIDAALAKVPGFAGLHIEGPHLSEKRRGAHDAGLIRPMENVDIQALVAAREKLPALMTTLAPESVTPNQVGELVSAGVKVSIGHSNAAYDEVLTLVDAGASMATHLFNAMSPIAGREPGMVGAALNSGSLFAGLIADGHHVHPATIQLALRAKKGPGRIFLVSDAMSCVGTDVTELVLNGRVIKRADGKLTLEDGTLAGADLDLATAVKVMHQDVGVTLGEALRMASLYPAHAIGLKSYGRLEKGYTANFTWLSDNFTANETWVNGQRVSTL